MGEIADQFAYVFRDFVTNGVKASGVNEVDKAGARNLGPMLETAISAVIAGLDRYATVAAMKAVTGAPNGTLAYVYANNNDPNDPANGFYQANIAAPGGWVLAPWVLNAILVVAQPLLSLTRDWATKTAGVDVDPVNFPGLKSALSYALSAAASQLAAATSAASIPSYTAYRLTVLETLLGLPHAPLPTPAFDRFDGPTGSLTGRLLIGGATWVMAAYSGSNTNPLTIATSGKLRGSQGATPNGTFGYFQATVSDRKWVTRRMTVAAAAGGATGYINADHVSVAAPNYSVMSWRPTSATAGVANGVFWNAAVNTVALTAQAVGTGMYFYDWDNVQARYYKVAGNVKVDLLHNGKKIGSTIDVTASFGTLALSHKYGFRGSLPATDGAAFIGAGDPDHDAIVSLFNYAKVLQREADGGLIIKFQGEMTLSAAPYLSYTIYDGSGGDTVLKTSAAVKSYVKNNDLTFTGISDKFTPPASGFAVEIARPDADNTVGGAVSRTGIQFAGDVFVFDGQSLITQLWNMLSGSSAAAPSVPAYAIIGTDGANAGVTWADPSVRYQHPIVAGSALAKFIEAYLADDPAAPAFGFVKAGKGATTSAQRLPGTAICDNKKIGIKEAGMNFLYLIDSSGEYDLNTQADTDSYYANKQTTMDDLDAYVGKAVVCIICPLGSVWTATDARAESVRRQQFKLINDFPNRYKKGPPQADLQHVGGDEYHLTSDDIGYGRKSVRLAKTVNHLRGKLASPRTGPKLLSVVRNSATQLTVTCDLNGASGLEIANSGYANDFRGGLRFSTSSTFATTVAPTAATINAVAGTTQSITYTFAAGTFPGTAYVSGPYGREPFNPEGNTLIRADVDNKQSMLRGVFAGEDSIPIQPYYNFAGGGDYVSGS